MRRYVLLHRFVKRREHPVRRAGPRGDVPRLCQQKPGEGACVDGSLDLGVELDRVVATVPHHLSVHLAGEARHDFARVAHLADEGQLLAEGSGAALSPPGGRAAEGSGPGGIVDKHTGNIAARRSVREGGVIGDAEVVAEPDERRWGGGHGCVPSVQLGP